VGAGVSALAHADLREALLSWAGRPDVWRPLVQHDPGERQYELVHRDEQLEVYVVCWMDGHDTGFHDHDESAAAIAVLQGAVTEERLGLGVTVDVLLRAGDTVTIAREAIHRVRHAGRAPAVTLHAYSPPLSRVGTYEVAGDGALLRHPTSPDVPLEAAA
jgi:quercetin dioxygenase-like cupin family protein